MHSASIVSAVPSSQITKRPTRWLISSSLLFLAASTLAGPNLIDEPAASNLSATLPAAPEPSSRAACPLPVRASSSEMGTKRSVALAADQPSISAAPPLGSMTRVALKPALDTLDASAPHDARREWTAFEIRRANQIMEACLVKYRSINDYTCVFSKRERIDGSVTPLHIMSMKFRTKPNSVYLRFQQPGAGREAIYIDGRNKGKVLAHDIGINKILAGTLWLDPSGSMAMEDNRHPITEAGIGPLIHTLLKRWSHELSCDESIVELHHDQPLGSRVCTTIDTIHPHRRADFMFHKVRVHIDRDLGLPVRFEAYDWPDSTGANPQLVEEYTYADIKLNVGLADKDFDVANAEYAFGRL